MIFTCNDKHLVGEEKHGINRHFLHTIMLEHFYRGIMHQITNSFENVAFFFHFFFSLKKTIIFLNNTLYAYHLQSTIYKRSYANEHTYTHIRSHFISSLSDFSNFSIIDDEIFIWSIIL